MGWKNGYWEEDQYFDIAPSPTLHISWDANRVSDVINTELEKDYIDEFKEKDKYTAEELRSTMESIKTRLIILCEMRGL